MAITWPCHVFIEVPPIKTKETLTQAEYWMGDHHQEQTKFEK